MKILYSFSKIRGKKFLLHYFYRFIYYLHDFQNILIVTAMLQIKNHIDELTKKKNFSISQNERKMWKHNDENVRIKWTQYFLLNPLFLITVLSLFGMEFTTFSIFKMEIFRKAFSNSYIQCIVFPYCVFKFFPRMFYEI